MNSSPTPTPLRERHGIQLFLLAAGLFVFLTAELYPVGAMPDMVSALDESESAVGRLVTWYAVGVGVATIPIVMATQRIARRTVIAGTLLTLAFAMGLAAIAPNLTVVAAARLIGAAAHGGIFAVVPVAAATLAPQGKSSQFVAKAFLGASVGVVAGPPAVAFLSQHLGWRSASATIAVLAAAVGLATLKVLPRLEVPPTSERMSFAIPTSMRRSFFTLCLVTALIVTAHNAAYAFIAPILDQHGVNGTAYAATLFVYGLAGAATTAVASRHLDTRPQRVTTLGLVCMIISLLALSFLPGPVAGVVAAVAWGGSFGVLPVVMQTRVLDATPGYNQAATPIYVVAFQVGISLGAFLGSVLILHMSALSLPLLAAGATALALPLLWFGAQTRMKS